VCVCVCVCVCIRLLRLLPTLFQAAYESLSVPADVQRLPPVREQLGRLRDALATVAWGDDGRYARPAPRLGRHSPTPAEALRLTVTAPTLR
jgi:hypothetical protein